MSKDGKLYGYLQNIRLQKAISVDYQLSALKKIAKIPFLPKLNVAYNNLTGSGRYENNIRDKRFKIDG